MHNVELGIVRAPDSFKSELPTIGNSGSAELEHVSLQPQKERNLHLAIKANDREAVENLISAGADINYRWNEPSQNNIYYWDVPSQEIFHNNTPLLTALHSKNVEIFMILLKAGADINMTGSHGWTPLLAVTSNRHPVLVDILIQAGADVNKGSNHDYTPLASCVYDEPSVAIAEKLLAVGATLNHDRFQGGQTPLHIAVGICVLRKKPMIYVDIIRTLASPLSVNITDNCGWTPLYYMMVYMHARSWFVESCLPIVPVLFHARCDMLDLIDFLKCKGYRIPHELLANDEAFSEWYAKSCNSPDSLKNLCRKVIYKRFNYRLDLDVIKTLPLPAKLQAYLSRQLFCR